MTIAVDIRCLLEPQRTGVGEYTDQVLRAMLRQSPAPALQLVGNAATTTVDRVAHLPQAPAHIRRLPNRWLNVCIAAAHVPKFNQLFPGASVYWLPNLGFAAFTQLDPYVLTLHDLSFLHYPYLMRWRARLWHTLVGYRRLLANAAHVIAVSEHTRQDALAAKLVNPDRISVVHSGVGQPFTASPDAAADAAIRQRLKLPAPYLLALGTHDPRKNLSILVEALPQLAGVHLVVAGPTLGLVKLKNYAQRLGVGNRVTGVGYVSEVERSMLYRGAAAVAYPSLYEGFGLPILEAMASGVPLVASSSSSIPEVARDAALLADPYDVQAWVTALSTAIYDPLIRERCQKLGQNRLATFTWEQTARQTLAILNRVAQQRPQPTR